jgi:PhnB protein
MSVRAIPDGYTALIPGMNLKGSVRAIEFFRNVFGAELVERHDGPDGVPMHVDMKIGSGHIMFGESVRDPVSNMSVSLYVNDCDAIFKKAVDAGSTVKRPLADQFYGDRSGTFVDPFGNTWTVATHKEDVSPAEMEKRMAAMTKT